VELALQRDQLKLSKRGRIVFAEKSGHNVDLTEPDLIAEEVKWVLEQLKQKV